MWSRSNPPVNINMKRSEIFKVEDPDVPVEATSRIIQRLENRMEKYYLYKNWILDLNIFRRDVRPLLFQLNAFLEVAEDEGSSELKHNVWETIAMKLAQIFVTIFLRKLNYVEKLLIEAKVLILRCCEGESKLISSEYLPGINYCLKGLEISFHIRNGLFKLSLTKLQQMEKSIVPFSRLARKGHVAVLAMRFVFIKLIYKNYFYVQTVVLDRMIRKDPESSEWYLWQHNVKNVKRRQEWYFVPPEDEEVRLIVRAAELCPNNSRILISLYSILAELVQERGPDWKGSEDIGLGRILHTSVEIVQFLKAETRKVLVLDSTSVKVNITTAEIFSSILPSQFWDLVLAKSCFIRALMFHPRSSKANGRMGVFQLINCKNPKKALKYFIKSFELDRSNFQALFDMLMTYLSEDDINDIKIKEILKCEFVNEEWSDSNIGHLYFVKGLLCYLCLKYTKAIRNWIMCYEKCGSMDMFKSLSKFKAKYGWQHEELTFESVYFRIQLELYIMPADFSKEFSSFDTIIQVFREEYIKQTVERNLKAQLPITDPWSISEPRLTLSLASQNTENS